MKLKHFGINIARHSLVVDVAFYQMDLKNVVESARKVDPDLFVDDGQFLPSWSKFSKNPIKAKGFFLRMLQSLFNGSHGHDEINFDYQRKTASDSGVYMMFLPANMKLVNLKEAANIAVGALHNFEVITLSSINGITNFSSQKKAKDGIELARKQGKKVLILATCLAQRSFSVGEISAVFLAYDNGEAGSTIQKISRGLTPNEIGKIGRIVSLSFDPRRDDKLDSLIIQTAVNYQKSHKLASVKEAIALVFKTVDIFNCTDNGAIKISTDKYLEEIVNQERISRVVGKMANVDKISDNLRECLLNSNFSRFIPETNEVTQKGKIGPKVKNDAAKQSKQRKTEDSIIREKIIAICENRDVVILGSNSNNLSEAIEVLRVNNELQTDFEEESGIPYKAFVQLVDSGAINKNLLDLVKCS
jgi:hypothetical protein